MTPEEMLAALEKAKADLAAAESLINEKQAELETAAASVATLNVAVEAVTKERDELKAIVDTVPALNAKIAGLEEQDRDLEKAVAKRVATLGIGKQAASPDNTKPTGQQLLEEFQAITDPVARADYFAAHAEELRAYAFKRS